MAPAAVLNNVDLSRVGSAQERSSRKTPVKAHTFPRSVPIPPPIQPPPSEQKKKVNRRSNKLIINWLHRKLVGTVKRSESASHVRAKPRGPSRDRLSSSAHPAHTSNGGRPHIRTDSATVRRKPVSLSGESDANSVPLDDEDDISYRLSSVTRESLWSPASAQEADDDASVRPLPPSMPPSPSPSPSRSSSSYLSHPHTFKSAAASTKPTTLLSIDLNSNGMAHIAQAPLTPQSHIGRLPTHPHARHSSLTSGSISFFALSSAGASRPNSTAVNGNTSPTLGQGNLVVQAPLHTTHHPRNNPRPSSPPLDNASVLTLASSAFGIPGRRGIAGSTTASALGAGDSMSHFDGSMAYADAESTSLVLGDDERLDERDVNASVRALRPRSSRRGSWDSEDSGWSAGMQQTPSVGPDKSLWPTISVRTGCLSVENPDGEQGDDHDSGKEEMTPEETTTDLSDLSTHHEYEPGSVYDVVDDPPVLRLNSSDTVAHTKESSGSNSKTGSEDSKTLEDDKPISINIEGY